MPVSILGYSRYSICYETEGVAMIKSIGWKWALLSAVVPLVVSCGGGSDSGAGGITPAPVATTNTTVAVNPAVADAVANVPFSFESGVPDFGTTGPTTLTFRAGSAFTIGAAGGAATGATTFGSCIFTFGASSFTEPGSPLTVGSSVRINPCSITIETVGTAANNVAVPAAVRLRLGTLLSLPATVTIAISPLGVVTVNGQVVGTVTITAPTGS
ncbi:hypothetical protein [uncultured Ramlibacter sp.]|uniref:hypothetical protein n=1 Tax=uncultured Ramlibacter sp. TaxID=260755 RepID=UPI0026205F84|nr:hypothetical protein [uncultured Ramlibacter sp.]